MPAGNGRGPMGAGPMTGRGTGFCAGYSAPGYVNPVRGCGYSGFGRGGGRGRRNQSYAADMIFRGRGLRNCRMANYAGADYASSEYSAEHELMIMKEQSEFMQKELAAINERIKDLETQSSAKRDNP